jgi:uncharacterized membrane protein YphA (DoxX/SURF4 family)
VRVSRTLSRQVDELIATAVRVGAGSLLLFAGLIKWRNGVDRFTTVVLRYEIVRGRMARAVGRAVPALEILLGALLLSGLVTRSAAIAAAVLVAGFTVAVGVSYARGRRNECGCGALGGRVGPRLIARNAGLLFALVLLSLRFPI